MILILLKTKFLWFLCFKSAEFINVLKESNSSSESEEEKKVRKKKNKSATKAMASAKGATSSKKSLESAEETEAIAIIYEIESEKHPFHHLDGNYASVELAHVQKYIDLDKDDVKFTNFK